MTEEKKEKTDRYELVQVPTDYGLGFRDNNSEEVLDTNQLLVRLANEISEVKKALVSQ